MMFVQDSYVNHIKRHRGKVSWVDQENKTFQIEKREMELFSFTPLF